MSWFIGYIGKIQDTVRSRLERIYGNNKNIAIDNLNVFYGGKNIRMFDYQLLAGYIYGYRYPEHALGSNFDSDDDIENMREETRGHFVVLSYKNGNLLIFNDSLGVREIFLYRRDDYVFFSTSPELINKIFHFELNFKAFAGRWILDNQFGYECIYEKIERYSTSSIIKLKNNFNNIEVTVNEQIYSPEENIDISKSLNKEFLNMNYTLHDLNIFVMLSGGLDSRFLLALMLYNFNHKFKTLSVGPQNHPDNLTAKKLSAIYDLNHTNIDINLKNSELIDIIPDFVLKSRFTAPVSEIARKYIYHNIQNEKSLLIDGSFGEIMRRGFYNKIQYRCKNALFSHDYEALAKCLNYFHADIFNEEFNDILQIFATEQIEKSLKYYDLSNSKDLPHILDLMGVREKLLNYNNIEQNRIDSLAKNLAPFSLKSIIDSSFNSNLQLRKNGNYIKRFINDKFPEMADIPLVKGNITLPFKWNTISSKLLSKIKSKAGIDYKDQTIELFLLNVKEYALDILKSSSAMNYEFYDRSKIKLYIDEYENDDYSHAEAIDWYLTFEVFRQESKKLY